MKANRIGPYFNANLDLLFLCNSDDEICKLQQGHGNTMLKVEDNMKVSQEELLRKDGEIRDLKVRWLSYVSRAARCGLGILTISFMS